MKTFREFVSPEDILGVVYNPYFIIHYNYIFPDFIQIFNKQNIKKILNFFMQSLKKKLIFFSLGGFNVFTF